MTDYKYWFWILQIIAFLEDGSRTIALEENCPATPKLTLTQTPTVTREQFTSGAIVWLSPNPKTNPNLDRYPNPNWGTKFPWRVIVRIPSKT